MRMNDDHFKFLTLLAHGQHPARFTYQQTAWALNFQEHDIPVLVGARLLKPLGNPPRTGVKHIAAVEVAELSRDRQWLAKATNAVHGYWQAKNHRKTGQMRKRPPGGNNQRSEARTPPNGEE